MATIPYKLHKTNSLQYDIIFTTFTFIWLLARFLESKNPLGQLEFLRNGLTCPPPTILSCVNCRNRRVRNDEQANNYRGTPTSFLNPFGRLYLAAAPWDMAGCSGMLSSDFSGLTCWTSATRASQSYRLT